MFLLLLLLAVQVVYDLYATSAVTAAAWDGARIAAGAGGDRAEAEDHVRRLLGEYGRDRVRLEWGSDPDAVVLTVSARSPSFLPRAVKRPLGIDTVRRTVRVRIEREIGP